MKNFKAYLIAQLQQPSTWRGLVLVITAFGVKLAPEMMDAIVFAGLLLAGGIGAAFPDK